MASTFTSLTYHVVYSTKYRRPTIAPAWRDELYQYIAGIVDNHNGKLLEIAGVEDHVHLLIAISPKLAVADMIRLIKANSSKWVNDESKATKFQWQTGYAAFTVSYSNRDSVRVYVRGQEEHHRRMSFQEEFLAFLERHQIQYDPRYVFEDEHVG